MAAPNHVDHQPPSSASSSASPKAGSGGRDPSVSPDRDPTRLLVEMLAGTALGMPMAAPNQFDQPSAAAPAAVVSAKDDDDDPTLVLDKSLATATLGTAAPSVSESPPVWTAASQGTPVAKPEGDRAERRARRRTRLRLIRVPTDYLRAEQESRDRRRRRDLVRQSVGRLFSVHLDRARERGISAMMARLTTTTPKSAASRAEGEATVSAAAPSPEHAGLTELLEKMAVSKKH